MDHTAHRLAHRTVACCCLLLLVCLAAPAGAASGAPPEGSTVHASLAPLSSAYLQSLIRTPSSVGLGQGLGGSPGPRDFAYTSGMRVPNGILILPETWDLRPGGVTLVKDQGQYNTCWSFAACGSLESCLLPGETRDFSEDNIVRTSGFDLDPYNGGGHIWMSTAYLVRWGGPVNESEDAYGDGYTPAGLAPRKHVQEVNVIPLRASATDNYNLKAAVVVYGAVDVSMGFYGSPSGSSYYNPATASYYFDGYASNNHEVLVVGWDDHYPASNFATTPPGDGAFIVKNSWGTTWGESGYFYVSYHDSVLGRVNNPMAVYSNAESTTNYAGIYQYDPLGQVSQLGVAGSTAWFANRFTAASTSAVGAVGFYTQAPDTSYEVYTGASLAAKTLATSGTLPYMGYHTVTLPSPVSITNGQPFVVAVKVMSPGTTYPIAVEYPEAGYSGSATAAAGQSYYSENGSSWTDATSEFSNMNVCLKAYTVAVAVTPPTVTSPNGGEDWAVGSSQSITWSTGNGGSVKIELSRNNGSTWETIFASTANDGSQSWTVGGAPTTQALARISNDNGSDTSDATFTISAPVLTPPTVTSPNGGEDWTVGSSRSITWSTGNGGAVKIELSRDNGSGWETLFASTANDGSQSWTVAGAVTTQGLVRISNGNGSDTSDATFTINAVPTAPSVTSPNGGENWTVGSGAAITWSTGNGGAVKIELSRDNGSGWETLFASTANDGSQSWTVAGAVTTQALVRISNDNGSDTSDATFAIVDEDVAPPTVSVSGYDAAWHNHRVTLTFTASDDWSGVDSLWWSPNDDPSWYLIPGPPWSLRVPAPANHSWDGNNAIWYYGEDEAGNYPDQVTTHCHVKIDTRKPVTKAPYSASATRGGTAILRHKVVDARPGSPTATVTIRVRNSAGVVVKTLGPFKGKPVNTLLSARFTVPRTWKAGTYRFLVYAKDAAGNAQVLPVGSNKLIVR